MLIQKTVGNAELKRFSKIGNDYSETKRFYNDIFIVESKNTLK